MVLSSTDIDPKLRFLVLYQDAQWASSRIAYTLNIPQRTIQDWISKIQQGIDITKIRPGRGCKETIPEDTKTNIKRAVQRKPQTSSTRKVGVKYEVSPSSVGRTLKEKGFKYKKVVIKTELDENQRDKRVKYCKNMLKRKGKPIDEIFFSDEMGIRLSEAHPPMAWMGPRKKVKYEKPLRDVKLNCWGAISKNGSTSLHIFKKNLNSERYEKIVQEHKQEMDELYPRGYLFMHDHLPLHDAVEPELERHGLNFVDFPTYSPDLNPLENVWAALKREVANDQPRTESELKNSLRNNWENLTQENMLRPYFENLHSRYEECIEFEGQRLPY